MAGPMLKRLAQQVGALFGGWGSRSGERWSVKMGQHPGADGPATAIS
jgi:hypothetical protein